MIGKMHPMLAEYTKHFPSYIGAILETYNGNGYAAVEAMNTLFKAVESTKPHLPEGHTRHLGGGVGLGELEAAAEIGIALGNGPLENIFDVIIKEDKVLTAENAKEIIGRILPCYALPKKPCWYFA